MQFKKIKGIILNIKPHMELDRGLSVFSKEYGRIFVMAKGVRKITSQRGFHLDLFNYSTMEIEECGVGASAKHYLREISTIQTFGGIKMNPVNLAAACLIGLFIERMIPRAARSSARCPSSAATR